MSARSARRRAGGRRGVLVALLLTAALATALGSQERSVRRGEAPAAAEDAAATGVVELRAVRTLDTTAAEGEPGEGRVVVLERLGLGRGFLGVQLVGLTDQLRSRFGVRDGEGALVSEVVAGSPAAQAGLRAGDVIVAIGSEVVRRTGDVGRLVAGRDGEEVQVEVVRDGASLGLTAQVAERRRPLVRVDRDGDRVVLEWIGGIGPEILDEERGRSLFDDALQGLELYFVSDEWRARARGPEHARDDGLETLDAEALELRIEQLKRRLDLLRRQLDSLEPPPGS